MKLLAKYIFLLLLFAVISCGKKTDPVPKALFITPSIEKITIKNTDEGVSFGNLDNDFNLIIEKGACETCVDGLDTLTILKAGSAYTDRNVEIGSSYFYRLAFKHPNYNVFSEKILKKITYAKPIKVETLLLEPINGNISAEAVFSGKIEYFEVFLDGKPFSKQRKKTFVFKAKEREVKIKIIPYDIYRNRGRFYSKTVSPSIFELVKAPENIKYAINNNLVYLSWNKVDNAEAYKIYSADKKQYTLLDMINVNYYKLPFLSNNDCLNLAITASNKYKESAKSKIQICK